MSHRMTVTKAERPLAGWLSALRRRMGDGRAPAVPAMRAPVSGLRRRSNLDIRSCVRLLERVYAEGQYPVHWPASPFDWMVGGGILDAWVVERHHRLVGHVAIVAVDHDPLKALHWRELTGVDPGAMAGVSRLFVDPEVRREGIGSGLFDVAVTEIRRRGLMPVVDVVTASTDAIDLYERRGWRQIAAYPWGPAKAKLHIRYYVAPN